MRILDTSSYQGDIDWRAVRRHNNRQIVGTYVRCREWRTTGTNAGWLDPSAWNNIEGAQLAGLVVGLYHRINPSINTPEREALELYQATSLFDLPRPHLLPHVDIEPGEGGDWAPIDVEEFLSAWQDVSDDAPIGAYTSGSYVPRYGGLAGFRSLWIGHTRQWAPVPYRNDTITDEEWAGRTQYTYAGRTTLHQYSHEGQVSGITGPVDLNALLPAMRLGDLLV